MEASGVRLAGLALLVGGLALAARTTLLLLGRGRPRRGPQPAFVLAGPYLRLRNPLFAGIVIALLGAALLERSTTLAIIALSAAIGAHAWVVRIEEPRLTARFGAPYAEYCRRVPRWMPRLF